MTNKISQIIDSLERTIPQTGFDYDCQQSCMALFSEYCRRMALWGYEFSLNIRGAYLINIPKEINSEWELNKNELSLFLKGKKITTYPTLTDIIIRNYIHWELYKDKEEIIQYNLSNPYEPFILLLKRGGYVSFDDLGFEILGCIFSKRFLVNCLKNEPFVTLDTDILDNIDKEDRRLK